MEQENGAIMSANAKLLGGKSWTAYFSIGLAAILLLAILAPLAWYGSWIAGVAVLALALPFFAYQILLVRSYKLYCDEVGVWVYSGILPWKKGVKGVKWRDLDEALYFQTFGSWLFNSYSIRIGHRFTKSSEIFLTNMARGNESAIAINAHLHELVRNNALA